MTKNPEEIRGGGLLRYCNLITRGFKVIEDDNTNKLQTLERFHDGTSIGKNKYIGGQKLDSNSCQFKKNHNDKMISLGSYLSQFSVHFYWWPIFDGQVVNLDLKSFRQVEDLNLT